MELSIEGFNAISSGINELYDNINNLAARFDNTFNNIENVGFIEKIKRLFGFSKICEHQEIDQLIILGKSLKYALDISLLDEEGNKNKNFKQELKRITIS
jgi:hypothetical protein